MSEELGARGRVLLGAKRGRLAAELEIFEKQGRSRLYLRSAEGESSHQATEAGWAIRAGDGARSCFLAGSGALPETPRLPAMTPQPVRLPPALPRGRWQPPRGLDAPLATEAEGRALLAGLARELEREVPGVRLGPLRLEEGASESAIGSSTGIAARFRARSAFVRVEASRGARRLEAEFVARSAADFKPLALARRIADRLVALAEGEPTAGGLLLAPAVAARLVAALAPSLVGSAARERFAASATFGSELVTLVDDGGRADGLLAAPCDGEGVPTRALTLVERGRFVQPLLAWWEAESPARAAGCSRRHGWRDLPRRGPTELFLAPEPGVAVPDLLAGMARGAYLIACEGGVRVEGDEFAVPVSGFAIEAGRATGGLGSCRLAGRLSGWLGGVRGVGRDLQFVPGEALFGSPTLWIEGGLELVASPRQ